jgi:DNA polymerase-3 subunit delta'
LGTESPWPQISGHEVAVAMLRRSISEGRLSHAYLFTGPPGVGKRTLALALAMTLNCEGGASDGSAVPDAPCGFCTSCSRIKRGEHPDVVEVNLETQYTAISTHHSSTPPPKELRIDTIREMQSTVGLRPYSGRWKVYILGDADRLNEEAANCLLKTLEEPPAHTVLVLLAPDEASLLPTISSRCFQVPLRPLPRTQVEATLIARGAEPEQAGRLAALSGGRIGWAINALHTSGSLENRSATLQELSVLVGSTAVDRIDAASRLAKRFTDNRAAVYETLDVWEGWWRDVLVAGTGAEELVINLDQLPSLISLGRRVAVDSAYQTVLLVQQTRQQLMENVNPRLALEALTLGLP